MAKALSQTKSAIAARARTRARILEQARAMNAQFAAKPAAPMTKGERLRAYLRSPEGQANLRALKRDVLEMQKTTLLVRKSIVEVQVAVAEAQVAVARMVR